MFSPTSRYGTADDFKYFVDQCHQAGIGVILDWVPAHFPSDAHGLARFDGTPLYEYEDPRRGWHPDWNSYIYDFGRDTVRQFLVASALFWLCLLYTSTTRCCECRIHCARCRTWRHWWRHLWSAARCFRFVPG